MECYKCKKQAVWHIPKASHISLPEEWYYACDKHKDKMKEECDESFAENGMHRIEGKIEMEEIKIGLTKDEVTKLMKGMKASALKTKLKDSLVTDTVAFETALDKLEDLDIFYVNQLGGIDTQRESHERFFEIVADVDGLFSSDHSKTKLLGFAGDHLYTGVTISGVKGTDEDHERVSKIIQNTFENAGFRVEWCGGANQELKIWHDRSG